MKACLSSSKSDSMPILKATVLGSRSASSLTKHPKNLNITNPRLSLSCSSQMNKRESSHVVALSDECLQCPPDSSMSICDNDAIRLSKVHKAQIQTFSCLSQMHITGYAGCCTICWTCRSPMDFL